MIKKIMIIVAMTIFSASMVFAQPRETIDVGKYVKAIVEQGGEVYIDTDKECLCVNFVDRKDEPCFYIATYEKQGELDDLYYENYPYTLYQLDKNIGIYSSENVERFMWNLLFKLGGSEAKENADEE